MELRALGRYRLMDDWPGPSPLARYFHARHEDEPSGEAPGYVAKLLDAGRGADATRRRGQFDHEIRLLESFNHPCIPTLHASGDQDGIPYMVLDRVDGVSLATLLGHDTEQPRALTKEIAVYVMGQLVDALRHVHGLEYLEAGEPTALGVVHRDLCPRNVWVSRRGDVILYDFTVTFSRWLPPEHDDPAAGALAYMAPERLPAGATATEKSDLFGMASILWECLRGERLFQGPGDAATREAIERFDISQPSRRVPGLSPKLGEILRKNLDRDPARRYKDAYQMLQRLAQAPEAKVAEQSRQALAELVAQAASNP
ncbi:MAG: serine/threonine protein kinase [Myxococcales bacterium]|nr:serine/threonine protein kinase [Myxococcales bacterium]